MFNSIDDRFFVIDFADGSWKPFNADVDFYLWMDLLHDKPMQFIHASIQNMTIAPNTYKMKMVNGPFGYYTSVERMFMQFNPVEGSAPKEGINLDKFWILNSEFLSSGRAYQVSSPMMPGKNYTLISHDYED